MMPRNLRTADVVRHQPSGEEWLVAWADYETGYMAPCGWPACEARIKDCELIRVGTDADATELVAKLASSGRSDAHRARRIAEREGAST